MNETGQEQCVCLKRCCKKWRENSLQTAHEGTIEAIYDMICQVVAQIEELIIITSEVLNIWAPSMNMPFCHKEKGTECPLSSPETGSLVNMSRAASAKAFSMMQSRTD
jgi:hypothetical protein